MTFEVVRARLQDAEIHYALIGGVALAARGAGRSTLDIDVLTTDSTVLKDEFWEPLRAKGIHVDIRKGDRDDPLAGGLRDTIDATSLMNSSSASVIIEEPKTIAPTLPDELQSRVTTFVQNSSAIGW